MSSTRNEGGPALTPLAPTADVEDRSGGVAGIVRQQPDDRRGHLFGRAGALHRDQRCALACTLGLAARGVNLGVDDARYATGAILDVSGRTALTRMPSAATSRARPTVKVSIAPLLAA
jgi:hypothetical protein